MVRDQIERRGISDPGVLDALRRVPRELFAGPENQPRAFDDEPLKIGFGQTISQPYIVALTLSRLDLSPGDRVLEVGTGSGYQTALLSMLCGEVVSVERIPELMESAGKKLKELGLKNIRLILGDGTVELSENTPFDAIAVTAAAPFVPDSLLRQLAPNGRMVIPVGERHFQELLFLRKSPSGQIDRQKICDCRFVPLIGRFGFPDVLPSA